LPGRSQSDSDATRTGTGLGLSIVRGLAEANGGHARYEPTAAHGSCFVVELPAGEGPRLWGCSRRSRTTKVDVAARRLNCATIILLGIRPQGRLPKSTDHLPFLPIPKPCLPPRSGLEHEL